MRFFIGLVCCIIFCSCTLQRSRTPLTIQIQKECCTFLQKIDNIPSSSYFTLFIPERTVEKKYIESFRTMLEKEIKYCIAQTNLKYHESPEKIFFLPSDIMPHEGSGKVLTREFYNGSRLGWLGMNAYWKVWNNILQKNKIDAVASVPQDLQKDLSEPLLYIISIEVAYIREITETEHEHSIRFDFFHIENEEKIGSYEAPLFLLYRLTP